MKYIEFVESIEQAYGVKCLHDEVKILSFLHEKGNCPSLEIQRGINSSISSHVNNLKRLKGLGLISYVVEKSDRRKRLYFLTDRAREMFKSNIAT